LRAKLSAAGLVLFARAYKFSSQKPIEADTRIGRVGQIESAGDENWQMNASNGFRIRFFVSAAAHGVTQKPTPPTN
jgi:hypothetical protein